MLRYRKLFKTFFLYQFQFQGKKIFIRKLYNKKPCYENFYGTTILLHYIEKQKIKEKLENFVYGDFSLWSHNNKEKKNTKKIFIFDQKIVMKIAFTIFNVNFVLKKFWDLKFWGS